MSVPKFISADEVQKVIDHHELLEKLEVALGNFSQGKDGGVVQPVRSVVPVDKHRGVLGVMPGYSVTENALATKLVTFYPENKDNPTHQAWVMIFEPSTGCLQAILDGEIITAIRTGMVSAIATKHLANPNSKILAIIGSGIQARSHYKALSLVQKFDEVRIWSRTLANARKCAQELGEGVKAVATAEEAVRNADVICTVTFATTPVIQNDWIKPGAHINAVGACRPEWQEIDSQIMRSSKVYVDSREACLKESGDVIISECEIYGEIGEVIMGTKEASWKDTTVFKSVGIAIEDVVSGKMVYDKYMKRQHHQNPNETD